MNELKLIFACLLILKVTLYNGQIKNAKTEMVNIYGNCNMCETNIEKAGNKKKTAKVDWNKDTKIASITYDTLKTNKNEILKRIALAGYDNDEFLAPSDAYMNLPPCCQYERNRKPFAKANTSITDTSKIMTKKEENTQLKTVFDSYFALKDVLVKTDGKGASVKGKELLNAINSIKMETLTTEEHDIWMKVIKTLKSNAETISKTTEISEQRQNFVAISENIYTLLKVSKMEIPIYYQHCPMFNDGEGANWLSKEKSIKNPYYGSEMMTCGKTMETIK